MRLTHHRNFCNLHHSEMALHGRLVPLWDGIERPAAPDDKWAGIDGGQLVTGTFNYVEKALRRGDNGA